MNFLKSILLALLVCAGSLARAEPAGDTSKIAPYEARFGRAKPVIAVIGSNAGTELSDFVAPYAILSHSGAAEVLALSTEAGPIQMRPALRIAPQATLDQFDASYPGGADYVIVPAIGNPDHAQMIGWLRAQSAKGATVVSICDGALVVARAGLFDGHRATGHWATQGQRERGFPRVQWLKNVRWVADGKVVSSAGISAAIPTSLALVEAIAGRERADAVAAAIGAGDWSALHNSEQFGLNAGMLMTFARNKLFSSTDQLAITLAPGMDELTLALGADAFARTARAKVLAVAAGTGPVRTRHGLDIIPDEAEASLRAMPLVLESGPGQAPLDTILARIERMYGRSSAKLAADTMEYPLASAPQAQ